MDPWFSQRDEEAMRRIAREEIAADRNRQKGCPPDVMPPVAAAGKSDYSPLADDIGSVLNRRNEENESNTPDFILAEFLVVALRAFNDAVNARSKWYGRHDSPGQSNPDLARADRWRDVASAVFDRGVIPATLALYREALEADKEDSK